MYAVDTDLAIIGNGEIIKDATIIINEDKITYAGTQEGAPAVETRKFAPVVTPGFWDCHGHYFGQKNFEHAEVMLDPKIKIMRCLWDLERTLKCGVTSIREVGGFGIYLTKSIQEGTITGPRIYSAGNMISMTAGHGDSHGMPIDAHRVLTERDRPASPIANGVPECLAVVRKHIRAGAEIIKFAASGGVMSEVDHPIHQQFSFEEQKAMVEEAARADMATAAHCYGKPGIRTALEAGVKTIEHGTYLDEDLCDLMIEKDAILVPTVYTYKGLFGTPEAKENTPEYGYRKGQEILETHMDMLAMAIKRGVKIAMGTDIIVTGAFHPIYQYGDNLRELQYFIDAGMTPLDAITAGTSIGPETLGRRAPKSGILREGYDADLVMMKLDPTRDISVLTDIQNINNVIRQGIIY